MIQLLILRWLLLEFGMARQFKIYVDVSSIPYILRIWFHMSRIWNSWCIPPNFQLTLHVLLRNQKFYQKFSTFFSDICLTIWNWISGVWNVVGNKLTRICFILYNILFKVKLGFFSQLTCFGMLTVNFVLKLNILNLDNRGKMWHSIFIKHNWGYQCLDQPNRIRYQRDKRSKEKRSNCYWLSSQHWK